MHVHMPYIYRPIFVVIFRKLLQVYDYFILFLAARKYFKVGHLAQTRSTTCRKRYILKWLIVVEN